MARKHSDTSELLAIRVADGAVSSISIASSSFRSNGPIPRTFSDYGDGRSPELHWEHVPDGAESLVLLVEDPDAPSPQPFVHWSVYNLPASVQALPESVTHKATLDQFGGAMQGRSSVGAVGYFGPRPPANHGPHHYHFELFALDATLQLAPGAGRDEIVEAMKGHVMACGDLVGTFTAPES